METPRKKDLGLQYELCKKSEALAIILSFFIMGAGQIYGGSLLKGCVWLIVWFFLVILTLVTLGFGGILWFPVNLLNIYDAYSTVKKFNIELIHSLKEES